MKKIQLSKTTVARLTDAEMSKIEGGFTWSLSMGTVCQISKSYGEDQGLTSEQTKELCQSQRSQILEAAAKASYSNC